MSQDDISFDIRPVAEEPKAEDILATLQERAESSAQTLDAPTPSNSTPKESTKNNRSGQANDEPSQPKSLVRDMVLSWVSDEDVPLSPNAWKELFTGVGLVAAIRHNWKFISLLIAFTMIYIGLGYMTRDLMIENDKLNNQLLDQRYKALFQSSLLRERTLRSNIEQQLTDTTLRTTTERPYLLPVEKEE